MINLNFLLNGILVVLFIIITIVYLNICFSSIKEQFNNTGKVFLFTNARDEDKIAEWVAHHLNIGFDKIYIFDHLSKIPIKSLFKPNEKLEIIETDKELPVKLYLMDKAAEIAKQENADWLLYLDADEFLCLNKANNVKEFLSDYQEASMIGINWLMFGTNNHEKEPSEGLIIENYTKSHDKFSKHVKSFVRPNDVSGPTTTPHFYPVNDITKIYALPKHINTSEIYLDIMHYDFNKSGMEHTELDAFIAHYIYQSYETYLKRKANRPTDDKNVTEKSIENLHSLYNVIDNFIVKEKYADHIKNTMKEIVI